MLTRINIDPLFFVRILLRQLFHPLNRANSVFHLEIHAYLYHGLPAQRESVSVALAVNLFKCFAGGTSELQFNDVGILVGFHREVGASFSSVLLHGDAEVGEQGEDDIHHLLVVTLIVGVVAIGDGREESVEERERIVNLSAFYHHRHLCDGGVAHSRACGEVVGEQTAEQSDLHLLVYARHEHYL